MTCRLLVTPQAPADDRGMGDTILCRCGCGGTLKQFDNWKRERTYLPGHYLKALAAKK